MCDHYDSFLAPALAATVLPFLNGESGSKSWADLVGQGQANQRSRTRRTTRAMA